MSDLEHNVDPDDAEVKLALDGSTVLKLTTKPLIPATVDGFAVTVGLAPYPPDAPGSHRRAIYAVLEPIDERARSLLASLNREKLLGIVPITPEAALDVQLEPGGQLAEVLAREALGVAVRELRKYGFAGAVKG
jgi:hypothetical protein